MTGQQTTPITIGIADDQQLFMRSLVTLVNTFQRCRVIVDGLNGEELIKKLQQSSTLPDLVLLDVNMPVMDGVATAQRISELFPVIRLVALSMKDDDTTVISMLRAGCCAYLLKDVHPDELEKALCEISDKGYYNADLANINYRRQLTAGRKQEQVKLTEREKTFLQLACSELTYKQIAAEMHLSERTIDGYREAVFEKLNVQSRVGMALEAIRRKWVEV